MHSIEELKFAQRYPFSKIALNVRRSIDLPIKELPEELISRAKSIILAAASGKFSDPKIVTSRDLLEQEVLAFPVARMLLSAIRDEELYSKFARTIATSTLEHLQSEKTETLTELASDLEIQFTLEDNTPYFAKIPLTNYLNNKFKQDFMRLQHQPLAEGNVFLVRHNFMRMIAESAYTSITNSLPIPKEKITPQIRSAGYAIKDQITSKRRAEFKEISEKLAPEHFPPCIAEMYKALAEGANLPHNERFALVTFLVAAGMPPRQITELFKNTPNFNRKTTEYQVSRIAGHGGTKYSPFSCSTMKSNSICNADCSVKHPLQYYRNKLQRGSKQKQRYNPQTKTSNSKPNSAKTNQTTSS